MSEKTLVPPDSDEREPTLISELMVLFADPYVEKLTYRAALTLSRQAARIAELEEGLRPFSDRCAQVVRSDDDDMSSITVRVKYLRRARALLTTTQEMK